MWRHENSKDERAQQNHWSEYGRSTPLANTDALGRPHRSVLAFGCCESLLMKMAYLIALTVSFLVLGCKREGPPAESNTYSDGSNTWTLGAVTMNGTNVPLTNVTVRAVTNNVSQ